MILCLLIISSVSALVSIGSWQLYDVQLKNYLYGSTSFSTHEFYGRVSFYSGVLSVILLGTAYYLYFLRGRKKLLK